MSSLYTRLVSGVLFPLHERLKKHDSVARLKSLEVTQYASADELEALRVERLRAFLGDIGTQVPYYRDVFAQSGFDPQAVDSVRALERLPLLDKAVIRAQGERMKAADHGPITRYNTGGSSGEPLIFYTGLGRKSHDVAAKWRATRWWGVDIGDPELVVWGSPVELGAQDRVRQIRDGLFRSELLPAFEMSRENLDRFVATIERVRPKMLFGYPSSLSMIAAHAKAQGRAMDRLGIKVVFVTSERLYDHQKETIEGVFGAPVANGYGARDAGFIAHACPSGNLHLSAEDIIVETIGADGQPVAAGEAGEIVVTHLATRDFPFVRYRTGDVGVLGGSGCACGRTLPILADVQGRTTDFIVAADGTVMHGLALIYTVRDLPGVAKFKIAQESLERTDVFIVADAHWEHGAEQRIVTDFKRRLGEHVTIGVSFVDEIPAEKSGKFRYVVSKVQPGMRQEVSAHA